MDIVSAFKKHQRRLLKIPNVVNVGIGEKGGKQVILVFVKKGASIPVNKIPKKIEGYETVTKEEIVVG